MTTLPQPFYGRFFKLIRALIRLMMPKYKVYTRSHHQPVVYVGHHQNLWGPVMLMLWHPAPIHVWVYHVFCQRKSCFKQYVEYTWTKRVRLPKWLATILAYPLSYAISAFMHSMRAIPVYRGSRKIIQTFKQSAAALKQNRAIAIFPDIEYTSQSTEVGQMYEGFLHVDDYYVKETGEHVQFVPIHIDRAQRTIVEGEPIVLPNGKAMTVERQRLLTSIQHQLNQLANS
ncbi:glycerol acyltransferase [Bacillaceae bacterium SIJ1]|uniref:lysophospholipid acyltransferase family protein n=1 Tax=Litoribacterium kuwaitense TaxID=1398745 RepID=UPI0013EC09A3|nr:glycerol acyltransferase [Litoribacterium kuwaitense]NGP45592.1 glycerol acyltransferase [Litoribacterium kuwaitense]